MSTDDKSASGKQDSPMVDWREKLRQRINRAAEGKPGDDKAAAPADASTSGQQAAGARPAPPPPPPPLRAGERAAGAEKGAVKPAPLAPRKPAGGKSGKNETEAAGEKSFSGKVSPPRPPVSRAATKGMSRPPRPAAGKTPPPPPRPPRPSPQAARPRPPKPPTRPKAAAATAPAAPRARPAPAAPAARQAATRRDGMEKPAEARKPASPAPMASTVPAAAATPAPAARPEPAPRPTEPEHEPAPAPEDFSAHPREQAPAPEHADVIADLEGLEHEPRQGSMLLPLLVVFIAVAAIAATAVYLFFYATGGKDKTRAASTPVIAPADKPVKTMLDGSVTQKPATSGKRKKIYDRITPQGGKPAATPAPAPSPAKPPAASGGAAEPALPPLPPPPTLDGQQGGIAPPAGKNAPDTAMTPPPPPISRDTKKTADITATPASGVVDRLREKASRAGAAELSMAARKLLAAERAKQTEQTAATGAKPRTGKNAAGAMTARESTRLSTGMAAPPTVSTPAKAARKISGKDRKDAKTRKIRTATLARPATDARAAEKAKARVKAPPRPRAKPRAAGAGTANRAIKTAPARPKATKTARSATVPPARKPAAQNTGGPIPIVPLQPRDTAEPRAFASITRPPAQGTAPAAAPEPVTSGRRANFKTVKVPGTPRAKANTAAAPRRIFSFNRGKTPPATTARPEPRKLAAATPAARQAQRPAAPRAGAGAGGYVVQLAAFRSEADARRAWQRIARKHGGALSGLSPIISKKQLGDAGTFYRLSIGTLGSRQQARKLCNTLIARGEPDCLIRKR